MAARRSETNRSWALSALMDWKHVVPNGKVSSLVPRSKDNYIISDIFVK